ncbi:flavin reductase family protein [Agreia pratensis]|uniref:NADH-FMN oxidoreductase RutF, flavin reductase (DIM6/NTAB) family n=1 Tax=Agreia pratensis TaxID=150121 RepID=A0A1X7I9T6_9MICO|nr:flavin reductase family protein [Agreia pratensis]MBF4633409.1 flavin reductase family protein [Agreia pratensis]SMG11162.1 NADH-FMN oxidoreductase RutF, flavin reductase (DIM6/NTAB) family [Agreia pratensis]
MEWTQPWAEFEVPDDDSGRVEMPPVPSDPAAVRQMFAEYPAGVAAICADIDQSAVGMVVTSLTVGASFDPPCVLVSIQRDSKTWASLSTAPRIGVSVLSENNAEEVRRLASRTGDRFDRSVLGRTVDGAVFISGARLWLECRILSAMPTGDHFVVVLEVTGASAHKTARPLIYHTGSTVSLPSSA